MKNHWRVWTVGLLVLAGCSQQDKDGLTRIARRLADKTRETTGPLREQIGQGLHIASSLENRVHCRLRWDKQLTDARIEVLANGPTVELKGTGLTNEQRRRAVELAESTHGVERVTDNLKTTGD